MANKTALRKLTTHHSRVKRYGTKSAPGPESPDPTGILRLTAHDRPWDPAAPAVEHAFNAFITFGMLVFVVVVGYWFWS